MPNGVTPGQSDIDSKRDYYTHSQRWPIGLEKDILLCCSWERSRLPYPTVCTPSKSKTRHVTKGIGKSSSKAYKRRKRHRNNKIR